MDEHGNLYELGGKRGYREATRIGRDTDRDTINDSVSDRTVAPIVLVHAVFEATIKSVSAGAADYLSGFGRCFSENLTPRAVRASPAIGDTTPVIATR